MGLFNSAVFEIYFNFNFNFISVLFLHTVCIGLKSVRLCAWVFSMSPFIDFNMGLTSMQQIISDSLMHWGISREIEQKGLA